MLKAVRNDDAIYKTVDQVMKEANFSRYFTMKVAEEADALIRIGRVIRINTTKLYSYLEDKYKVKGKS